MHLHHNAETLAADQLLKILVVENVRGRTHDGIAHFRAAIYTAGKRVAPQKDHRVLFPVLVLDLIYTALWNLFVGRIGPLRTLLTATASNNGDQTDFLLQK